MTGLQFPQEMRSSNSDAGQRISVLDSRRLQCRLLSYESCKMSGHWNTSTELDGEATLNERRKKRKEKKTGPRHSSFFFSVFGVEKCISFFSFFTRTHFHCTIAGDCNTSAQRLFIREEHGNHAWESLPNRTTYLPTIHNHPCTPNVVALALSRLFDVSVTTTYFLLHKTISCQMIPFTTVLWSCHKQMTLHSCLWSSWSSPKPIGRNTVQNAFRLAPKKICLKTGGLFLAFPSSSSRFKTPQTMLANKTFSIFTIAAIALLATVKAAPAAEAAGNFLFLDTPQKNGLREKIKCTFLISCMCVSQNSIKKSFTRKLRPMRAMAFLLHPVPLGSLLRFRLVLVHPDLQVRPNSINRTFPPIDDKRHRARNKPSISLIYCLEQKAEGKQKLSPVCRR